MISKLLTEVQLRDLLRQAIEKEDAYYIDGKYDLSKECNFVARVIVSILGETGVTVFDQMGLSVLK